MPRGASTTQRIAWHAAHQKRCACRPIPAGLLKTWVVVIGAVLASAPLARAGDSSFDRVLGWSRETNAIINAEWEWPGKAGARGRPFNLNGHPLDFHGGGLPLDVTCEWPQKAVMIGVDAPDARFACRWSATHGGPVGPAVAIGFWGQRLPPERVTLERGRHPGDLVLAWNEGGPPRRLLWIAPFDPEREKVDLRGAWSDGDWVMVIVHRVGESLLGIPYDIESVEAFRRDLALDQTEAGRARWRQWLLPTNPAVRPNLNRYRTALETGSVPAESILPAMREAEAYGRLDLAELFFRRGVARLSTEEAARIKSAVATDAELRRTRKLLARAGRAAPATPP